MTPRDQRPERTRSLPWLGLAVAFTIGCGDDAVEGGDAGLPAADAGFTFVDPSGCSDLFSADWMPTIDLSMAPEELTALEAEFLAPFQVYQQTGTWPSRSAKPYHPLLEFRIGDSAVTDAQIRLKGQSSWYETLQLDGARAKMQFVISFNEINPKGRYFGVRKLELDMPFSDQSMLRQRVGLSYMRVDLGVPAQCANHAKVFLNGIYYGTFTLLERLDKEFLQRNFPGAGNDDGTLWDADPITNELTATRTRLDQLNGAATLDQAASLADLDASLLEWAGEAMMPDGDGYYGGYSGPHNYYIYDHPARGFLWLPHDLDATMSFLPSDTSPLLWSRAARSGLHYALMIDDVRWRDRYAAALCGPALAAFDVPKLHARIDAWAAQIRVGVATDPHYTPSEELWRAAVDLMKTRVGERKPYVERWCDCYANGGADADGDGTPWCLDAADEDPTVKPGAAEVCGIDPVVGRKLDDNCNGYIDEGCP
jgi:hypothetical protein